MAANLVNLLHGDLEQLARELDTNDLTARELRAALTNVTATLIATQIHNARMQAEINELRRIITKAR